MQRSNNANNNKSAARTEESLGDLREEGADDHEQSAAGSIAIMAQQVENQRQTHTELDAASASAEQAATDQQRMPRTNPNKANLVSPVRNSARYLKRCSQVGDQCTGR